MKKIIFCFLLFMSGISVIAQHSPQQMRDIFDDFHKQRDQLDEEPAFDTIYQQLQTLLKNCENLPENATLSIEKAIWHNQTAELLDQYKHRFSYKINRRTAGGMIDPNDLLTWDKNELNRQILFHHQLALQDDEVLKQTPIADYKILLDTLYNTNSRPTLYDFLAFRFCSFLMNNTSSSPFSFVQDVRTLFTDNEHFIALQPVCSDSLNFEYHWLRVLQKLTAFHLHTQSSEPIIDISLYRLQQLYNLIAIPDKSNLYEAALLQLASEYFEQKGYENICLDLGLFYFYRASQKNAQVNDYITAVEWNEKAIRFAPESLAATNAQSNINKIKDTVINFKINQMIPSAPELISLTSSSSKKLYVIVLKNTYNLDNDETVLISRQGIVYDTTISVVMANNYRSDTTLAVIPALPYGEYILFVSPKPLHNTIVRIYDQSIHIAWHVFQVTDLSCSFRTNQQKNEFIVTHRRTGAPVQGAVIELFNNNYRSGKIDTYMRTVKTDKNGKAVVNASGYSVHVSHGNDKFPTFSTWASCPDGPLAKYNGNLFTDRAIYRPGQLLHYKGIIYHNSDETESCMVENQRFVVELKDANYEVIAKDTLTTNEYGSFAGTFQLPANGLTGSFSLICSSLRQPTETVRYHYFRVEEYKRPQFEIEINPPTDLYKIGENVAISGAVNAFAGYPLPNVAYTYSVTRQTYFPFRYTYLSYDNFQDKMILATGSGLTDEKGNFELSFIAEGDKNQQDHLAAYYYQIEITVTDANGESHVAQTTVRASQKSLLIQCNLPGIIKKGETPNQFELKTVNMSGQPQTSVVQYRIESLRTPEHFLIAAPSEAITQHSNPLVEKQFPFYAFHGEENPKNWEIISVKAEGSCTTSENTTFSIPNIEDYEAGCYHIFFTTTDSYGEIVEREYYFTIYGAQEKKCPVFRDLFVRSNLSEAKVGEKVVFDVGTYRNNANVYIEIISNSEVLYSEWRKLNQEVCSIPVNITEKQRGTLYCYAYSVENGNIYTNYTTVIIPFSNKKINFEFVTFRDLLQPGEKEAWKIKLTDENGVLRNAELLCAMYDASLDEMAINSFSIDFNYVKRRIMSYNFHEPYPYFMGYSYYRYFQRVNNPYPEWIYTNDYPYYYYYRSYAFANDLTYSADIPVTTVDCSFDALAEETGGSKLEGEVNTQKPQIQIRKNFAETAFFYPFLRTDENGIIDIEFTMPESLTKWKCCGLAHTQDAKVGTFEKFVQTRKELMIIPNAPRFLYERDTLLWTAKIVNTGANSMKGSVTLEFYNTETGIPISTMASPAVQPFTIAPNGTQPVDFKIVAPSNTLAVSYRIIANAKPITTDENAVSYSDGEEKSIPVLTKRMLITESVPLYINKKGTKKYSIDVNEEMQSCVLEFTPNPDWNALLAMPYLMTFPYECNEQVFNRLYSNLLADAIMKKQPELKNLLKEAAQNTPEALRSKLSINEELKQTILMETPWVNDAQSEENNIQNLFTLFDEKMVSKGIRDAVSKLENSQNEDGGWAWFPGGLSSDYITQYILLNAGCLQEAGIIRDSRNFIGRDKIKNSVNYIDKVVQGNYEKMKKRNPNYLNENWLTPNIIQYLYARSFYLKDIPVHTEAYSFYEKQLLKYGKKQNSIYLQTMSALALYKIGIFNSLPDTTQAINNETHIVTAHQIMSVIKKRAQYSDEMGMFWKKEGLGYYWHESLIERQALMIKAFSMILKDNESVEMMKIWLLQQKRTQNWSTTRSTADACGALLLTTGKNEKSDSGVTVEMCGQSFTFQDNWQLPIKRDMTSHFSENNKKNAEVTLTRNDNQLSYGAVYHQFWQDMDSVKATSSNMPLSIQRSVYKVDINERGEVLTAIDGNHPLSIGDKLRVKLILKSDRDMEFVHLKDLRAAAFEPLTTLSGYRYQGGLFYYESYKDASVNFFFDFLPQGTYVFEYTLLVNQAGTFNSGFATIQCMYAAEFTAHSQSRMIRIAE